MIERRQRVVNEFSAKHGIGERLTALREEKKLTVKDLYQLGVSSPDTLFNYEHNNVVPKLDCLEVLADFYGVRLAWLICGEGKKYARNRTTANPKRTRRMGR